MADLTAIVDYISDDNPDAAQALNRYSSPWPAGERDGPFIAARTCNVASDARRQ